MGKYFEIMYINFTSHNTQKGSSSAELFNYLDKENSYIKEQGESLKNEELFFNQNMNLEILRNADSRISLESAIEQIDQNRGTQNLKSANFYMLNISPSQKEIQHLEDLATAELEKRGLYLEDAIKDDELLVYYNEQKEELLKMQLKLYTKEVMTVYADEMDREVYANQDNLPNNSERKKMKPTIDKDWQDFLVSKGVLENKEVERTEIALEQEQEGKSEKGRFFKVEEETIFIPNDLIVQNENSIFVDKEFLERQVYFSKYKNETETIKLDVEITKEQTDKIEVEFKPTDYENNVRMWVNKRDIVEKEDNSIVLKEHRGNYLIDEAIKRDISDNERIFINEANLSEVKKVNDDKENYVFLLEHKGLEKPLKLTIDSTQVEKTEDGYNLKNYVYQKAYDNALKYNSNNQYSEEKEQIKNKVWGDNGFDTTKRKLEHSDLLYFGKVEQDRTYKFDDKNVLANEPILKEIKKISENKKLSEGQRTNKIEKLESTLVRDKYTNEVIKQGVKKGGANYHIHVVVSRHDGFSKNPQDKVSMSPVSHQKESTMNHGKKVGFDRKDFREKAELTFDKAFKYDRPFYETFNYKNSSLQNAKGKVEGFVVANVKKEILEKSGIYDIKREANPIKNIKDEISFLPIPTSIPKGKIDLLIKAIKLIKNIAFDKGLSH